MIWPAILALQVALPSAAQTPVGAITPSGPSQAALSIVKTHTGDFMQGQKGATYTVTVSNDAAAGATSEAVNVIESVPSGLTLVSMSGLGWSCAGNTCVTLNIIGPGQSFPPITVTVDVAGNATSPQVNAVSVAGGGSVPSGTTDSTNIVAGAGAVLGITKMHFGSFAQGQMGAIYSVTVSNSGGPTSGTVTVTDTLPSGLTLVSMAGDGWTCAANSCTRNDTLAAGLSYPPITVTVNVAATATSPQVNAVTVSGGGSASASTTDSTIITNGSTPGALTITKAHTGNFTQGQMGATYTVTVSNPQAATGPTSGTVTVTETVPLGLTLVSMAGAGWTCGANSCSRSDPLVAGQSYPPITVTVNVAPNAPSSVTNSVTVSGGGSPNSTATDPTIITGVSGPSLILTPITLNPGDLGFLTVCLSAKSTDAVFVTLTSSDASVVSLSTVSPSATANVIIPAGQTCATVRVIGGRAGSATITATANGYAPASITQPVGGGTGAPSMTFSPASLTITAPGTQNLTLTLSTPAPAAGLTVMLSSSNPAAATVPATVTIGPSGTTATVTVTGVAAGSATITASAPGFGSATAAVTVTTGGGPGPTITLTPPNPKLNPGDLGFLMVCLSAAPTDSVFVMLTSSDASVVSLSTVSPSATANVLIQAGKTCATVRVIGGNAGVVTITATAPGYPTATVQVMVGAPAMTLTLDFGNTGVAPGNQGFSYTSGSATPETAAFSSSGGVLHLNTQGLPGSSTGDYRLSGVFDSSRDIALSTRLQVYPGTISLGFLISDVRKSIGISFSDAGVTLTGPETNVFVPFNTTDGFHSYVFTSAGDSGAYNLLIDGLLKATGTIPLADSPASGGSLIFGQFDGVAKADFDYIHYSN